MAVLVVAVVAIAWYATIATMGVSMTFANPAMASMTPLTPLSLAVFLAVMSVMMVAMMLPAALPMILAFHGMNRLEAGRPTTRADRAATALFVLPYFLVWGAFGVLAVVGLVAIGLMGPFLGALALVPVAVLAAAGLYQLTRSKEVCLTHCQSPMGFVMRHWRSGRRGAVLMGLRHSLYCLGCCWLLMVVLFVVGAMSLMWMGLVSLAIFAEKAAPERWPTARIIGILLVAFAAVLGVQAAVIV